MRRIRRLSVATGRSALTVWLLCVSRGAAQEAAPAKGSASTAGEAVDHFQLSARSETYLELYRQALVPGQYGDRVPTETASPVTEYLSASAHGIDAPWQKDGIDLEFAAWGRVWPTSSELERPFDGDVQTASVRGRVGPAWVRLGRQQVAGGAARFTRFDGLMLGAERLGLFAEGYGGFTVLPRWNGRPGYESLGSEQDELLSYDFPEPERSSYWLAGGRIGYAVTRASGSVSLHEERRDGELDRSSLGLDLSGRPADEVSAGASALLDLDSKGLADLHLYVDGTLHPMFDLGVDFQHAEPALLLSRQSVLSVFTNDGYEEVGGTFTLRAARWLRFDTNGHLIAYDGTGPGARGEIAGRLSADRRHPTFVRVAYARVIAPDNGYQSFRVSLSRKLSRRVGTTVEAYGYFYDQPIAAYSTSSFYAGTVSYRVLDPLELLFSGSLASSAYAALDARSMVRATYAFDAPPPTRRR